MMMTENWTPGPSPKYTTHSERIMPPEATIKRVLPVLNNIGIDIGEDLFRVDTDGIPVYMAARKVGGSNRFSDTIYYKGKGDTEEASRASAIMESVERACSEEWAGEIHYCTYGEIRKKGAAVDPREIYCRVSAAVIDEKIEWVRGFDIMNGEQVFGPLNCVIHPYRRDTERFYYGSIGLSTGNNYEEAICHGICEVIEHDATAMAMTSVRLAPRLHRKKAAKNGLSPPPELPPSEELFPLVSLENLPRRAAGIVSKLRNAGVEIILRDITTDIGVCTAYCVLIDKSREGHTTYYDGQGCHPDTLVAVTRSLNEAAQSRSALSWILRKHSEELRQKPLDFDPFSEFGRGGVCRFSDMESNVINSVDGDIGFMFRRLKAAGLDRVLVFDLTKPEFTAPVVRIIIPKVELWASTEAKRTVLGDRAQAILMKRLNEV